MISTEELMDLLNDIESDRVERTESTTNTNKFAEAICAFSNDMPNHRLPGYLIVGAKDDGTPLGLRVTDQLLQNLAAIRSDGNVQPLPMMSVNKYVLPDGKELAVVEVQPSDMPPVRYRGRVHIRVGPRRGIASEHEERMLAERRTARSRTFDGLPCKGSSLDDLVPDLFLTYRAVAVIPEVINENNRNLREQMASLRFYDLAADCPTNAGVLMFGKDPRRWMPGAYVQFVRWNGTVISDDPINDKRFSGDLLTVLRGLKGFLELPIQTYPVPETALRERMEADYPAVAIRELLWNAIMHRSYDSNAPVRFYWYDDRIEIQNPGGLYGMASPENFPRQTDYRNPVIAEAMSTLGYVNAYGRGVLRAQDALVKNGNPPADFTKNEPTHFLAVIWRKP